jgi:DNA-binding protein HU-beta
VVALTKREQVILVSRATGLTARHARDAIDAFAIVIQTALVEDAGRINVDGLGIFEVVYRAPRRVMNPATGVMMELPASTAIKFRPAPKLRKRVQEKHS